MEHLNIPGVYRSPTYSHAVRVGNLIFCSGVSAREPDGRVHAPGDALQQAEYCFTKLATILAGVGCGFSDIVKITTYVTRYEHRAALGDVKKRYLVEPMPASTGVVVDSLSDPDLICEIDVVAVVP
jgi:enamine deaminase RidA (YjgF/YER057c/UK114 family)